MRNPIPKNKTGVRRRNRSDNWSIRGLSRERAFANFSLDKVQRDKLLHTILAIINPFDFKKRPGPVNGAVRPSAYYRSYRSFTIKGNNQTGSEGRFALSVRPTFGNRDDVHDYQISIWSPTQAFPDTNPSISTTDSVNWVSSLDGRDPRIDDNVYLLAANDVNVRMTNAIGLGATTPFGTPTTAVFESGVGGVTRFRLVSDTTGSQVFLPPGVYSFSGAIVLSAATTPLFTFGTGVTATMHDALSATRFVFYDTGGVTVTAAAEAAGTNWIRLQFATLTASAARVSVSQSPEQQTPSDFGEIGAYQVGQMAVWFEFTGPAAWTGGSIYSVLASQNSDEKNFKSDQPPSPGSLLFGPNIARIARSYQGPVTKGTYVIYQHADQKQRDFHKPSTHSEIDFPEIVISGYAVTSDGSGGSTGYVGEIGQLRVATNFFFDTPNNTFSTKFPDVSEECYEQAWAYVMVHAHAMENDNHYNMFKQVMSDFGKGMEWLGDKLLAGATNTMSFLKSNPELAALAVV